MNLPNGLTCGRLLLCLVLALVFSFEEPWRGSAALAIFVVASITDWLDGVIARKWGLISDLGTLLDPLADKVLVSVGFIGLVAAGYCAVWIVAVVICREFLVTGLRVLAGARGIILPAEKAGKIKTISQMVALSVGLLVLAMDDGGIRPDLVAWSREALLPFFFWIVVAVTVYSGLNYFMRNRDWILTSTSKEG